MDSEQAQYARVYLARRIMLVGQMVIWAEREKVQPIVIGVVLVDVMELRACRTAD
jgi:hypothetical protein